MIWFWERVSVSRSTPLPKALFTVASSRRSVSQGAAQKTAREELKKARREEVAFAALFFLFFRALARWFLRALHSEVHNPNTPCGPTSKSDVPYKTTPYWFIRFTKEIKKGRQIFFSVEMENKAQQPAQGKQLIKRFILSGLFLEIIFYS